MITTENNQIFFQLYGQYKFEIYPESRRKRGQPVNCENPTPLIFKHSGMNDFEVGSGSDRQVVEARFSFVWKKDDNGVWKIVHHHNRTGDGSPFPFTSFETLCLQGFQALFRNTLKTHGECL